MGRSGLNHSREGIRVSGYFAPGTIDESENFVSKGFGDSHIDVEGGRRVEVNEE